jgi:hypothetical protein
MHAGSDDLLQMMQRLTALRKDYRRDREFFEIRVISFDAFTVDGVTDVIVGLPQPVRSRDGRDDADAEDRCPVPLRRRRDREV